MKYPIIRVKKVGELRNKTSEAEGLVVVEGGDDKINRACVENNKVDILLSPEKGRKDDSVYFRNSGLNHILCKLANKNQVAIGFNFDDLEESKDREILIGRIMQNIRLCRKYKVDMVFDSFGNKKADVNNLISFARVLGMTPGEAKKALSFKKKDKSKIKLIENR